MSSHQGGPSSSGGEPPSAEKAVPSNTTPALHIIYVLSKQSSHDYIQLKQVAAYESLQDANDAARALKTATESEMPALEDPENGGWHEYFHHHGCLFLSAGDGDGATVTIKVTRLDFVPAKKM